MHITIDRIDTPSYIQAANALVALYRSVPNLTVRVMANGIGALFAGTLEQRGVAVERRYQHRTPSVTE